MRFRAVVSWVDSDCQDSVVSRVNQRTGAGLAGRTPAHPNAANGREHAPEFAAMVEEIAGIGRRIDALSGALTSIEGAEVTVSDLRAVENHLSSARRRLDGLVRTLR